MNYYPRRDTELEEFARNEVKILEEHSLALITDLDLGECTKGVDCFDMRHSWV